MRSLPPASQGSDIRTGSLSQEISPPYGLNKLRGILRQLDQNKVGFRVKITLARFIDDPQIVAPGSRLVGNYLVHLARLKVRLARSEERRVGKECRARWRG